MYITNPTKQINESPLEISSVSAGYMYRYYILAVSFVGENYEIGSFRMILGENMPDSLK